MAIKTFADGSTLNEETGETTRKPGFVPTPEPTVGQVFSGVSNESAEERNAREAVGNVIKADADIIVDEDAIRQSTTKKFQSEIDALNKIYSEKKRVEAIAGEGRLGEVGAIQARRGLLGSDFGGAITAGQRDENLDRQGAIEAEKGAKLSSIFSQIRDASKAEFDAKTKAKALGTTNYLQFLRDTNTRKKQYVSDTVRNAIINEVELSENDFSSIAEQLGVSVDDVKADYKTQSDAETLRKQTAQALSDKNALEARETEAGIAKTLAEAGTEEAKAKQFDIDNIARTNKIRADFEQQAFDNNVTLSELQLDRDKYETDTEFKNANLDLATAKTSAEIDKIYDDIEQNGKVTPAQQLAIFNLQKSKNEQQAKADKAKINAGNRAETLKSKIDLIDSLLGTGPNATKQEIANANEAIENLVGTTVLGRKPLASAWSVKNRALVGGIGQLVSQETLDTLTELKKSGATLGAISEKELNILQSAATQINTWEDKDENGRGMGRWNAGEAQFKAELQKIKDSTERLRAAAEADSLAGEGVGNKASFEDVDDFLQNSSTLQQESADNLKNDFFKTNGIELEDSDLIDLINEQSGKTNVGSDTNQASLPKEIAKADEGDAGGQCGRFVNKATGLGVGDTFKSKMAKMDSSIKEPEPGMVFTMPYKDTGHCGFVVGVEGDNVLVKDSNWSLDEKVKTHSIPKSKITGLKRV